MILRPEGGLFFANADQIRQEVLASVGPGTKGVILDGETVAFVDVTAAQMLRGLRDQLESSGVGLYMAKDIGQVRDVILQADPERPARPPPLPDDPGGDRGGEACPANRPAARTGRRRITGMRSSRFG